MAHANCALLPAQVFSAYEEEGEEDDSVQQQRLTLLKMSLLWRMQEVRAGGRHWTWALLRIDTVPFHELQ